MEQPSPLARVQLRDLQDRIARTPADWRVKGMYFTPILQMLKDHGLTVAEERPYVSFRDYPLRDFMRLKLEAAQALHPRVDPKNGLRLLGQVAFPTLMSSTVGRVIFAVAGRSWSTALQLVQQAYNVSVSGRVDLVDCSEQSARVRMRDVWNFPDCYHVGVFEGAMRAYKIEGQVVVQLHDRPCDVDLQLSWKA